MGRIVTKQSIENHYNKSTAATNQESERGRLFQLLKTAVISILLKQHIAQGSAYTKMQTDCVQNHTATVIHYTVAYPDEMWGTFHRKTFLYGFCAEQYVSSQWRAIVCNKL